jgi:hypothetical protein
MAANYQSINSHPSWTVDVPFPLTDISSFTQCQELLPKDVFLKPHPIRHSIDTIDDTPSISSIVCIASTFDRDKSRSAFTHSAPNREINSLKYHLPMKRHCIQDEEVKPKQLVLMCEDYRPCTPDTAMSSNESIHSTPYTCQSQMSLCTPPNLHYQSPTLLIELERSAIPSDIMLPPL